MLDKSLRRCGGSQSLVTGYDISRTWELLFFAAYLELRTPSWDSEKNLKCETFIFSAEVCVCHMGSPWWDMKAAS